MDPAESVFLAQVDQLLFGACPVGLCNEVLDDLGKVLFVEEADIF